MSDDVLKEAAVAYAEAEYQSPYAALADEIYVERVLRARRTLAVEKILAGQRLFESACEITLWGIRSQNPGITDDDCLRILRERLAWRRRREKASMTTKDVMLMVVDALQPANIPAMLVGSFSSNYYGIPRSTEDVDFVIQIESNLTQDFTTILGSEFEAESQLTFETNTGTQKQEFKVAGTVFKVELFRLSNDPFDQERFRRRVPVEVEGRQVWFPTAEDVVVMKLRWARTKDKDDIKDVMTVQRGKLDWPYIESWCHRHGTLALMEKIRSSVPEI